MSTGRIAASGSLAFNTVRHLIIMDTPWRGSFSRSHLSFARRVVAVFLIARQHPGAELRQAGLEEVQPLVSVRSLI
jgi:hypothetical protein